MEFELLAFALGAAAGWFVRHKWWVGVEREIRNLTLLSQHLLQRAANEVHSQCEILELLERKDQERAARRLACSIAAFYETWKPDPDHQQDSDCIHLEVQAIEEYRKTSPTLGAALQSKNL